MLTPLRRAMPPGVKRALRRARQPSLLLYRLLGGPHPYRLHTAARRALPDFLIIGAMRAGSTSLYRTLASHPQILPAQRKEIHFLDDHFRRGVAWYRAHFPHRRELHAFHALTGEATPHYLFDRRVPARAAALLPEARLIAILRHPAQRALSHYWHQVRRGHERRPLEEAIRDELRREAGARTPDPRGREFVHHHFSYLARGRYLEQLERWLEYYPTEQLHLVLTRDLNRERPATLDGLITFLGLPPHAWPARPIRRYNRARYPTVDRGLYDELLAYFRPHNAALAARFGLDLDSWDAP